MGKRNRDKLLEQSMYDLLLMMQKNLEKTNGGRCIMYALGEDRVYCRCTKHNGKCNECLKNWMNEDPF